MTAVTRLPVKFATALQTHLERSGDLPSTDISALVRSLSLDLLGGISSVEDPGVKADIVSFLETELRPDAGATIYAEENAAQVAAFEALKSVAVHSIYETSDMIPPMPDAGYNPKDIADLVENGPTYVGTDGTLKISPAAQRIGEHLEATSLRALTLPTFEEKISLHASGYATQAAAAACASAGITDAETLHAITNIFYREAYKSAALYRTAFSDSGKPLTTSKDPVIAADATATIKRSNSAAGLVAFEALPELWATLTGQPVSDTLKQLVIGILEGAATPLISEIVAHDIKTFERPSVDAMIKLLENLIPADDWAFGDIAGMPKDDKILALLGIGVRLANVTWGAGQLPRTLEEDAKLVADGKTPVHARLRRNKVDSDGKEKIGADKQTIPTAFNMFDVLKAELYRTTYAERYDQHFTECSATMEPADAERTAVKLAKADAFTRVVFEVFKDLKELRKGLKT